MKDKQYFNSANWRAIACPEVVFEHSDNDKILISQNIKITYRHRDHFVQNNRNTAIPGRAILKKNQKQNYFTYIICD